MRRIEPTHYTLHTLDIDTNNMYIFEHVICIEFVAILLLFFSSPNGRLHCGPFVFVRTSNYNMRFIQNCNCRLQMILKLVRFKQKFIPKSKAENIISAYMYNVHAKLVSIWNMTSVHLYSSLTTHQINAQTDFSFLEFLIIAVFSFFRFYFHF